MGLSAIFDPLVRAWFEENGGGGGSAVDDGYYITWDKNTAGRPFIDLSFMMNDSMTSAGLYKVSDAIISAEGFDGFAGTMRLGSDGVINADLTTIVSESGWTAVFLEEFPLVVSGKAGSYNYNGIPIVIPADGTYFLYTTAVNGDAAYTESIYNSVGGSTGGGGGGDSEDWIGDGNTHIWISLPEGRTSPMLGVCPNGTVTVDWGDGTEADMLTGTSTSTVVWAPTHHYARAGDYRITLTVDGEMGFTGHSGALRGSCLLRYSDAVDIKNAGQLDSIQKVECGGAVTAINSCAFLNCRNLQSIKLPDGLTAIGSYAFDACCNLRAIVIPESVRSIGEYAFQNCAKMQSVNIPEGVTSIEGYTFYCCPALQNITIPKSVVSIKSYAFCNCSGLQNVEMQEGLTTIEGSAFYACLGLPSVNLPNSVKSIGGAAFAGCISLMSCNLSEGVTILDANVFANMRILRSLVIPKSVTSIASGALQNGWNMLYYDFSQHESVPTLKNSAAFSRLPDGCEIRVPAALESSWKTATNWSTYADYIVGV